MTLILENGSGVVGANSNVTVDFVTQYLTDRNRETENGWNGVTPGPEEDAACVAGTDYIETRFKLSFKGSRFYNDLSQARATLEFAGQPADTETVTLGATVYTWTAAAPTLANQVLIDTTVPNTIQNLVDAINANPETIGDKYGTGTVQNDQASATPFVGDALVALSRLLGTAGNGVVSTSTTVNAIWNFPTLNGGSDIIVPQPLSFPRQSLFTRDGVRVEGMPSNLLFATSEYAVRARASVLAPDPVVDPTGGTVLRKKEKVGPIEEDTSYEPGTAGSGILTPYPAADRLLEEYTVSGGRAIRG